jgi:hypothetical protein
MVSSLLHVLIVTPVIFYSLRAWRLKKQTNTAATKRTNARDEEAESPESEVVSEEEVLQD